ncbi:unnamed protein product [Ophioblennius macclurei]
MVRNLKTKRCFLPADGGAMSRVRLPVTSGLRRPALSPPQEVSVDSRLHGSITTEEERKQVTSSRVTKKRKTDGNDDVTAQTNEEELPGPCGLSPGPRPDVPVVEQQGAAEHCRDSMSAELLTVTIQQRSHNREFGQIERRVGLTCHVCKITCDSLEVFREHMSGPEHLEKLQQVTWSISQNTRVLQHRGRRLQTQRWCETCQTHFSGSVIVHRQGKQHKVLKRRSRPFCPVCRCHFRTPRKFVEHMKSVEHKQQVQQNAQEEELITVDAVGCFEGEQQRRENEEVKELTEEGKPVQEKPMEEEVEVSEEEESGEGGAKPNDASGFLVPVCGFVCQCCNKFFNTETAARHTHYLNLQSLGSEGQSL